MVDVAGNVGTTDSQAVTIDTTGPTIAITTPIAGDNVVNASEATAGFTIQGTTTGVENGQTVTVTIVNSSNPTVVLYTLTTTVTGNAWSLTVPSADHLADGGYTVKAAVSDVAGNPATQATQAITVDETPPTTVTNVTYTTNTGTNEIDHNSHGIATITLHFSAAVTVTGALTLSMNIFAQPGVPDVATYVSGSGSQDLVFTFTPSNSGVGGADQTTALAITAVNGTITNSAGNAVNTSGADVTLSPHLGVNEPAAPAGVAGEPINLALIDPSGVGALTTMTISGMPADWSLNQGTNLGNGTWTVETNDLSALMVTTAAAYTGATVLSVTETWTNADGSTGTAVVSDNVEAYCGPGSPIFALSGNDTLTRRRRE